MQTCETAEIAAKLTEAQRDCLMYGPHRCHAWTATINALRRRGLLDGIELTAKGSAVRAYLQEQSA